MTNTRYIICSRNSGQAPLSVGDDLPALMMAGQINIQEDVQMNELQIKACRKLAERIGFDDSQDELVEKCVELIEAAEGEDYDDFIKSLADVRVIIEQVKLALDDDQQEQYEAAIDDRISSLADCIDCDPDDEPF